MDHHQFRFHVHFLYWIYYLYPSISLNYNKITLILRKCPTFANRMKKKHPLTIYFNKIEIYPTLPIMLIRLGKIIIQGVGMQAIKKNMITIMRSISLEIIKIRGKVDQEHLLLANLISIDMTSMRVAWLIWMKLMELFLRTSWKESLRPTQQASEERTSHSTTTAVATTTSNQVVQNSWTSNSPIKTTHQ